MAHSVPIPWLSYSRPVPKPLPHGVHTPADPVTAQWRFVTKAAVCPGIDRKLKRANGKTLNRRDAARIICRSNYLRRLVVEASASFARLTRWYVTRRCRVSTWNIIKQREREREREERFRLNWFLWRQRSRGKNLIWMWFDSYFLSLSIFNFHRRWKIEGKLPNNELPNREKISKLAWKRSDRRPATLNERQRRVENRTPRYGGNTRFRFNDPKNFSVQQKFKQNQARQFANVLELPWNYERNQIERVCERENVHK